MKLGTDKRPAVVRVRTTEDAEEIVSLAAQRDWIVIVGVEPDEIEDISDLQKLMRTEAEIDVKPRLPPKISGNDYCPCRNGKKSAPLSRIQNQEERLPDQTPVISRPSSVVS